MLQQQLFELQLLPQLQWKLMCPAWEFLSHSFSVLYEACLYGTLTQKKKERKKNKKKRNLGWIWLLHPCGARLKTYAVVLEYINVLWSGLKQQVKKKKKKKDDRCKLNIN